MDEKLIKHYKEMQIGVDEPFRFHCTLCGKCCMHREDIILNAKDLFRIAKKLDLMPNEITKKYCDAYIGHDSRLPIIKLRPQGPQDHCPLLNDCKCTVHDAKPTVCAMFPIGRFMETESSSKPGSTLKSQRTGYIYVDPGCGDDAETHTVREWLSQFGIPLEDPFFQEWNQTIMELSRIFHAIEIRLPKEAMSQIWIASYMSLYFNYDLCKDFTPQFRSNTAELLKMLQVFHGFVDCEEPKTK